LKGERETRKKKKKKEKDTLQQPAKRESRRKYTLRSPISLSKNSADKTHRTLTVNFFWQFFLLVIEGPFIV
jgi:hypothetical protein